MLRIEELVLRVPGYNKEEAQTLGQEVARHVADGLPVQQRDRYLGALDFILSVPAEPSRTQIVRLVSKEILEGSI